MRSKLNLFYLDDGTPGGNLDELLSAAISMVWSYVLAQGAQGMSSLHENHLPFSFP